MLYALCMWVLTADQKHSRTQGDRVPHILDLLARVEPHRPFQRTVGDEIQAVFMDAGTLLEAMSILFEAGDWHVGIGAGSAELPLPEDSRDGRGEAFLLARQAVEQSKRKHPSIDFQSEGGGETARALLTLLAGIWSKRTESGWEAVRAMQESAQTQGEAAKRLGISEQAFTRRLQAALWQAEQSSTPAIIAALQNDSDGADRA